MRRGILTSFLLGFSIIAAWTSTVHAASILTYGLYGQPDSLDSAKMATTVASQPAWLICDALVNVSADGKGLDPGIAESWTLSASGRVVRMQIRSGLTFHDGTPVDAEAVRASFERHFRPGHPLYTATPRNMREQLLKDLVEHIEVLDPSTIVLTLRYPEMSYLTQIDIVSPTAAARLGAGFGKQPVCSGPFKFASWTSDQIVVEANDRYWMGRPRLDRVVFRIYESAEAVVDAVARGEVDFMPHVVEPDRLDRIRPIAHLIQSPLSLNITYLGMRVDRPPFNDANVRQAVVRALNIPAMMVFLGRGSNVPATGPLSPDIPGHDPSVQQAPYSAAIARGMLARTKYPGSPVPLVYFGGVKIHTEVAIAIQNDLLKVGVPVSLAPQGTMKDLLDTIKTLEQGLFINAWNARAAYAERFLLPLFQSSPVVRDNLTRYSNPALDKLLDRARQLAPEDRRRREALSQAQRIIVDDAPMAFLYHAPRISAVSRRVRGLAITPSALPYDKLVGVQLAP